MTYTPDPELVGLLGELNEQPERTLLNLPSYDGYLREPISHRRAGLSSLEREILQAHREEAAYLLNYAAHILAFEERTAFFGNSTWLSVEDELSAPTEVDLGARAHAFHVGGIAAGELVSLLVPGPGLRSMRVAQAARGAMELEPGPYPHLHLANWLLQNERPREAMRHARVVVRESTDHRHVEGARRVEGVCLLLQGQAETALASAFSASHLTGRHLSPSFLLLALLCALRSGASKSIRRVAELVDAIIPPSHPQLQRFCSSIRRPGTMHHRVALQSPSAPKGNDGHASSQVFSALAHR